MSDIKDLTAKILAFADDRKWRQFHSPTNLAMGVSVEAGELLECFQFDRKILAIEVQREIADICIYLFELADSLNIDIKEAVEEKLAINAERYFKEKAWGSNKKYDKL